MTIMMTAVRRRLGPLFLTVLFLSALPGAAVEPPSITPPPRGVVLLDKEAESPS